MAPDDISYLKAGYKREKWKWVLSLPNKDILLSNPDLIIENISESNLLNVYEMDKLPKMLPCSKKCLSNPWCLENISPESASQRISFTKEPREPKHPIGLQNTANTCWINSALQSLFHLKQFRSCVNSIEGFKGEDSLSSFIYLLQAMFVEMDLHKYKALECVSGSVFEKLAIFASKEIMQKDQDFEVLKCVSEFLENTIDNLLGETRSEPVFSPLFKISFCRIARWTCTSCQRNHVLELPPSTCYMMAAYVTSDECPLEQCILDLQTETQTGVCLDCGKDGEGCGASVTVDRVVTPKIISLPEFLIIRNNSSVYSVAEYKKRFHVVYPETLDLSAYTCDNDPATYSLRAVIYHHGHWIQHFSAHVKTENGKWYNFNDENVEGLVTQTGVGVPLEVHKNYFSLGNVAAKYKHKPKVRISRGAFIWIYERIINKEQIYFEPSQSVTDYILNNQGKDNEQHFHNKKQLRKIQEDRKRLFNSLSIVDKKNEVFLISQPLLSAWIESSSVQFLPEPALVSLGICEHKKFDPSKANAFKCIRKDKAKKLISDACGIHTDSHVSVLYDINDAICRQCVAKHIHHILFREHLQILCKEIKKIASKIYESGCKFVGSTTLRHWPALALKSYLIENGMTSLKLEENLVYKKLSKVSDEKSPKNDSSQMDIVDNKPSLSDNPSCSEIAMNNTITSSDETKLSSASVEEGHPDCENTSLDVQTKVSSCDTRVDSAPDEKNCLNDETRSNSDTDIVHTRESKNSCKEEVPLIPGEQSDSKKDEASMKLSLFNEDVICPHNMLDPKASGLWVPNDMVKCIMDLCKGFLHSAIIKDFDTCAVCEDTVNSTVELCEKGKAERKLLYQLYLGRRRPNPQKNVETEVPVYLISKEFHVEWRNYLHASEKGDLNLKRPELINNEKLVCKHQKLLYSFTDGHLLDYATLVFEEEWKLLTELYPVRDAICGEFDSRGTWITPNGVCEDGCVESEVHRIYEDQFNFKLGLVNVWQVNSKNDVPHQQNGWCNSQEGEEQETAKKRQKLSSDNPTEKVGTRSIRAPGQKQQLVRSSKVFSSDNTLKEVQNFIAEKTAIWPIFQTLWLAGGVEHGPEPLLLTDEHRDMTLRTLRIKPGDTVYFKAAMEDLEKAAGDGVTEYSELEDE